MNSFGIKLRYFRKKLGLTQKELAKKLNISASTIGMYEQGRREPDFRTLNNVCNILSVQSSFLLGNNNQTSELREIFRSFVRLLDSLNLSVNGKIVEKEFKHSIIKIIKNDLEQIIDKIYIHS